MSLSPNPNVPREEDDLTQEIEPNSPDAVPLDQDDATVIDAGPADPRPVTEPDKEFDTTIGPHFL